MLTQHQKNSPSGTDHIHANLALAYWGLGSNETGLRSHVEDLTTMFPEFTLWLKVAI